MISLLDAKRIISAHLEKRKSMDYSFALLEDVTREEEFGWIFFYTSKEYLETGDPRFHLAGNSPIIVDRYSGRMYTTGTAHPVDFYIEKFKRDKSALSEIND